MSAITIDGELVHYEVLGRGRPVVLVHGWIGSWRYWVPTMQLLQSKFRVYALDLFGFGDSSKNPDRYSVEHQIEMLADFTQALGLTKTAVVGHGLGALLSAEFARRYPARVPRMMLVSAPLYDTGDLEQRSPAARKIMQQAEKRPSRDGMGPDAPTILSPGSAMRAALAAYASQGRVVEEAPAAPTLRRYEAPVHNPLAQMLDSTTLDVLLGRCFRRGEPSYDKLSLDLGKTDLRALHASVATFDAGPMLDTLWLLTMPTMILHGGADKVIEPPNEDILRYITQEKNNLLMPPPIPNIGHFPMLEDERFPRLVADFLEASDISGQVISIKERWRRRNR
ncbi:MAG: alpha/beta hydrolase [Anaerolineae bacterium]|nr:alpha/beta hydrolase [Anaerolineae bacterium]